MTAGLWAFAFGCTVPVDVGSDRLGPRWVGVLQDVDGDGSSGGSDCDDEDPTVGQDAVEVCDLRDNDCDGSIDEDGVCRVTEWFDLRGDLDLLIVVDASDGAMTARERFIEVLPRVIEPLFTEGLGAQIAVVGANAAIDSNGSVVVPYGEADDQGFVQTWYSDLRHAVGWVESAISMLPGDTPPRALDVTSLAVEGAAVRHETFNRPRAALAVLYVAPMDDLSSTVPEELMAQLGLSEQGLWRAHGLVSMASQDCKDKPWSAEQTSMYVPPHVRAFIELSGGVALDQCSESYLGFVEDLADALLDRTARREYVLGHRPQSSSLRLRRVFEGASTPVPSSQYIVDGRVVTFIDPPPVGGALHAEYDLLP